MIATSGIDANSLSEEALMQMLLYGYSLVVGEVVITPVHTTDFSIRDKIGILVAHKGATTAIAYYVSTMWVGSGQLIVDIADQVA